MYLHLILHLMPHTISGDAEMVAKVSGREDIDSLDGWTSSDNLQPLNLL